jgi:protein O-GlcNAc transferase
VTEALAGELNALVSAHRFSDAAAFWNTRGRPLHGNATACQQIAVAFAELGRLEQAIAVLTPWLQHSGGDPASYALAGRLSLDLGRTGAALSYLGHAVRAQPTHVRWWRLLAEAALADGNPSAALAHITPHRLRFNTDVDLAFLLIRLLMAASRVDEALLEFERALARWPHHPEIGSRFARFVTFEFPTTAAEILDRAQWEPDNDELTSSRVSAALAMPAFHATDEANALWHQRIIRALRELTIIANNSPLRGDDRARCLSANMFFAPYTELDVTELMFAWGDFVESIAAPLRSELPQYDAISSGVNRPVKTIGFVTNRGPRSSAGRLFHAWIEVAARAGFVVHVFALGEGDDKDDVAFSALAKLQRFPEEHPKHWRAVAEHIVSACCDLLVYPEPQGSSLQMLLAGIKLAPFQAAGFGNPVTTGLRTMDYFLTPEEAESPDGEQCYRERLIRLSATWSAAQAAPSGNNWTRADFGGGADEHWYVVTQPMMKWSPRFRSAIIDVLRRDPQGRLVFVQWASAFSPRAFELMLRYEFSRAGLNYAERVLVVGFLSASDYSSLLSVADVALDSFGFSGGVSTADALALGQTVVTLPGQYLRGRQSAALVERLGAPMDIVERYDDFVSRCIHRASTSATTASDDTEHRISTGQSSNVGIKTNSSVATSFGDWLASLEQ